MLNNNDEDEYMEGKLESTIVKRVNRFYSANDMDEQVN